MSGSEVVNTEKRHILAEIRRLTEAASGKPPGLRTFERETGVRRSDWFPNLWLRWGDAIQEAGFARNILQKGFSDELLLEQYARLAQRLSRLPVHGELLRESKGNASFPSETTFRRFGGKQRLLRAVAEFCGGKPGYDDVLRLCENALRVVKSDAATPTNSKIRTGFVYLMKSGRHYKIGRTNSLPRRNWELGIKLPIPPRAIHHIETEDPTGVEAYWHKRFEDKRGEGEWFNLNSADVMAFKQWKRIV